MPQSDKQIQLFCLYCKTVLIFEYPSSTLIARVFGTALRTTHRANTTHRAQISNDVIINNQYTQNTKHTATGRVTIINCHKYFYRNIRPQNEFHDIRWPQVAMHLNCHFF